MFGKHMLCIAVVAVGFVVTAGHSDTGYSKEVYSEILCLSKGGMCVRADDCPKGSLAETKGLCPAQQKSGVECCYGLPMSETRCRKRGGECMSNTTPCADNLTFKRASDCALDQKCCILV